MTMTETRRRLVEPGRSVRASFPLLAPPEMRAPGDGSTVANFRGEATVFDHGYEMYGGPAAGGWLEFVDRGSLTKTLSERPDVAFLINHGGMTLARTKSGTLSLEADSHGLQVAAQLDTRMSTVADLAIAMERGDINEMSFAFRIVREQWLTADGQEVPWWDMAGIERHLTEISLNKGDVSVVNYGANDATSGQMRELRSAFDALAAGRTLSGTQRDAVLAAVGPIPEVDPVPADEVDTEVEQPAAGLSLAAAEALGLI